MEIEKIYDYLIEREICSEETLKCMTGINGYTEKTLNDVLYYFTGYHDMEQYTEYEDKETYNEYFGEKEEEEED